ncbi:MAG TPA: Uma2 family endonuclease [Xanthobacteraceae bacterium]|jgi:Uma2 family endonuclease
MNLAVARAADGLPRRVFTVDDVQRMMEAGIFREDERFELIEGDLVMMSPKHVAHERIKYALNIALVHAVPKTAFVATEATIQLAHDVLLEPDLAVISKSVYDVAPNTFAQPRPEDVLLLIEVAASSLRYDRKIKARLYARHGIREFWVIDAKRSVTWVHTGPAADSWSSIVERGPTETLTSTALPNLAVCLADMK